MVYYIIRTSKYLDFNTYYFVFRLITRLFFLNLERTTYYLVFTTYYLVQRNITVSRMYMYDFVFCIYVIE